MASVPEETFMDFRARVGIDARRIPIEGTIETTFRCNLRCAHCYVNEAVGDSAIRDRELSTARVKELIDEIVAAGTLFVLFTGGEVLVRPDFPEIYVYAVKQGLLVTVFTNGTLVTERMADLFAEYRPDTIEISLYGMTRETYERVTQIPGSYDKCLAGIQRLRDRGLPLKLKTMALSWNYEEIPAMEEFAKSRGLFFRFDSMLNPRVDCGANRNGELQLSAEQAVALDLADPARMDDLRRFCEAFTRKDQVRDTEEVYTCGAGQSSFTVDPYGQLQMCQLSRRNGFDLTEGAFLTGWNVRFPELRARKWQENSVCRKCSLMSLCSSCPGAAEMETGSIEGIVKEFCEIAHLRAHAAMGGESGHRRDARCCLGEGTLAGRSDEENAPLLQGGGCGSCGSAQPEPPPALIQIGRRPASPAH